MDQSIPFHEPSKKFCIPYVVSAEVGLIYMLLGGWGGGGSFVCFWKGVGFEFLFS